MTSWRLLTAAFCLIAACAEPGPVEPIAVAASDGTPTDNPAVDVAIPIDAARTARQPDDAPTPDPDSDAIQPRLPGAGDVEGGGVWVVDSAGQPVGALVRRGSDDNLVYRSIYDMVTVYHPESGLFFEITMTDGIVRRPSTTFYATANCEDPIGISYGGCSECRSGPGIGLLHDGQWYRVTPGVNFEVTTSGSTLGSGLEDTCSPHHTASAKVFPLNPAGSPSPPTAFTPPLHFAWR
jgi:hypothetical protein